MGDRQRDPEALGRALFRALDQRDADKCISLITARASLTVTDRVGLPPLSALVRYGTGLWPGFLDVLHCMLAHNADINTVNSHGTTVLSLARFSGRSTVARLLSEYGAVEDPLGREDAEDAMEDDDAIPDADAAALNELEPSFPLARTTATDGGDGEACDAFDSDAVRRAALMQNAYFALAERFQYRRTMRFLRRHPRFPVNCTDEHDWTPLMWALGSPDMMRALLQRGARVDAADKNGLTALAWAVRDSSLPAIPILLDAGANPNVRYNETAAGGLVLFDPSAKTMCPLVSAAVHGEYRAIPLLLDAGASPTALVQGVSVLAGAAMAADGGETLAAALRCLHRVGALPPDTPALTLDEERAVMAGDAGLAQLPARVAGPCVVAGGGGLLARTRRQRRSPLYHSILDAAGSGAAVRVRLLLAHGACPRDRDTNTGLTALMLAAGYTANDADGADIMRALLLHARARDAGLKRLAEETETWARGHDGGDDSRSVLVKVSTKGKAATVAVSRAEGETTRPPHERVPWFRVLCPSERRLAFSRFAVRKGLANLPDYSVPRERGVQFTRLPSRPPPGAEDEPPAKIILPSHRPQKPPRRPAAGYQQWARRSFGGAGGGAGAGGGIPAETAGLDTGAFADGGAPLPLEPPSTNSSAGSLPPGHCDGGDEDRDSVPALPAAPLQRQPVLAAPVLERLDSAPALNVPGGMSVSRHEHQHQHQPEPEPEPDMPFAPPGGMCLVPGGPGGPGLDDDDEEPAAVGENGDNDGQDAAAAAALAAEQEAEAGMTLPPGGAPLPPGGAPEPFGGPALPPSKPQLRARSSIDLSAVPAVEGMRQGPPQHQHQHQRGGNDDEEEQDDEEREGVAKQPQHTSPSWQRCIPLALRSAPACGCEGDRFMSQHWHGLWTHAFATRARLSHVAFLRRTFGPRSEVEVPMPDKPRFVSDAPAAEAEAAEQAEAYDGDYWGEFARRTGPGSLLSWYGEGETIDFAASDSEDEEDEDEDEDGEGDEDGEEEGWLGEGDEEDFFEEM